MSALLEPQPAPQMAYGSTPVWLSLIEEYSTHVSDDLREEMMARAAQGVAKYGVPLTTHNGRQALVDAYQEALDLCVYLHQDELEQSELEHGDRVGCGLRTSSAITLASRLFDEINNRRCWK